MIDSDLGFVLLDRGDFRDALDAFGRAIEVLRAAHANDPTSTIWQIDLARSLARAGDANVYLGNLDDAIRAYREALALRAALVVRDKRSVPWRRATAWSHAVLADALLAKGSTAEALAEYEQTLALRSTLVDESPAQRSYKDELAQTELFLGRALLAGDATAQKRGGELIGKGLALARADNEADRLNTDWQTTLIEGLLASAEAARVAGDDKARRTALVEALAVAEPAAKKSPQNAHLPGYVAEAHAAMAELGGAGARDEWMKAREAIEGLAAAGRLPATRKALLAKAIAATK
jgi:tetratricopeptide (TPR) repeat protein